MEVLCRSQVNIIFDFYGFPAHYYQVEYPNRGSRVVAERVMHAIRGKGIQVQGVKRGLDHGVWVGFLAAFNPGENPLSVPVVQGILIIGTGMSIHNLHDYRVLRSSGGERGPMPYASTFDDKLKDAATSAPAHPTLEHILPMFIAAGAARDDTAERLWTCPEASLNWAQYRFGRVGGWYGNASALRLRLQ
ncbi:Extradiol ring-cleavage dioxygenase, class III enzyme, subunit B [Aspergillus spectabilis]